MCGILGEFTFKKRLIGKNIFLEILRKSKTRGPDNTQFFSNNLNLQIGFNRLKILDLKKSGNQPIRSLDKRYLMVYNGEIYNYLEIKKRMKPYGLNFQGNGDTEVLVNAISIFGLNKTIQMLDGMFAIALFDNKRNELSLVRDFAGIKPLHYGIDNKVLFFASQYNQIVSHPSFYESKTNPEVLKLYLLQHHIPAPFGILDNTFQVSPGETILFNKNGRAIKNMYWEFPKYKSPKVYNSKEALEKIEYSLKKSVISELVSDVPIGTFLSSGIDSPLISYFSKQNIEGPLKSVTIGSNSSVHDESALASFYAEKIGLDHVLKKMNSKDAVELIEDLSKAITEPFADISIIPTFLASKISKKYFTVALSGDGGDELFFGYERFWSIAKNIKLQKYPFIVKYFIYGLDKILTNNKNFNSACLSKSISNSHFYLHSRFDIKLMNLIFPELKKVKKPISNRIYDYPETRHENELIQFIRNAEFYGMMQKTLKKIDMASMAHSLEVRVPFLQKRIIEDSLNIDPYLNYGPNKGRVSNKKVLLKKLLKQKIPNSHINNIKKGFSIPLTKWIQNDLYKPISEVLLDKRSCEDFAVDLKQVEIMLNDHRLGKNDFKWPIFTLFSLFIWRKNSLS